MFLINSAKNFASTIALSIIYAISLTNLFGAEGPGFPNIDRPPSESGTVLSLNDPGKAISAVSMHRGYLFVPLGFDHCGGQGAGAFALYDISDPSNPTTFFDSRDYPARFQDINSFHYVGDFAELHHIPISEDYVMISERRDFSAGYSILNLSPLFDDDPATLPEIVSRYSFPGVTSPGNYDGYSFAPAWQGQRYLYAPTGSNGLMIIDTSDFSNPQHLATIPRSQLGNRSHRSAVVIGNQLILSTVAIGGTFQAIIFDISDPASPQQLSTFSGPLGYQTFTYGSKFYGGGSPIIEHDFSDPRNIVATTLNNNPGFDRPEYGFGKDDFLFIGHYPGMTKWSLNGNNATLDERVDSGIIDDHAFITPIGNLIAVTSDHNNDRKLILGVHDHQKDVTPPAVNHNSPADGETNVSVKSRVGVCFTDFIDPISVGPSSLIIRDLAGNQVAGTFSTMQGIVNFAPNSDLAVDTTYQVLLSEGGIADQSGNSIPSETLVATFSTGSTIDTLTASVVTDQPQTPGNTVTLSVVTENAGIASIEYAWDFGDGSPVSPFSTNNSIDHTYQRPGNHLVTAYVRRAGETITFQSTAVQVIHAPINSLPPVNSSTIVVDEANQLLWTVNTDNDSVSAINTTSFEKIFEIPVGKKPSTLCLGPGNSLWIVNKDDATVNVINRSSGEVINTYSLPLGSAPHAIVIDSAANAAYISLESTNEITKLDTNTGSPVGNLTLQANPRALSLDRERGHLWVTRFISPDEGGRVTKINTANFTIESVTPLAPVMEPDSLFNGRGIPNYLGAMAISPDGTQAYIPSKKDNIFRGELRDGNPLTFEHTVRSMAANLDLDSSTENAQSRLDFDNNDFATAAVFSPLGNQVFFSTNGSASIWVVDAYDPTNVFSFSSGGLAPQGLAISSDGAFLFVHNFMTRNVTVFNTNATCSSICGAAPQVANVSTVTSEKLTPEVLVGKQLFYDSSDPRLSQESYMSCASCHLDGSHDGRVWDFTNIGEGLRNTIDLRGKGVGHGPIHWSANFDESQDFEEQIRKLSGGVGLMADADYFSGSRAESLGEAKAGHSADLDALAAYIASLTQVGESPHKNPDGSLTTDATVGRDIFISKGCSSCHSGTAFTDSESRMLHDVGTMLASSGQRLDGELTGLDTPSLRGLWLSSPYLHDGRADTLEQVLVDENISGKHGHLFDLSQTEIDQLVAYLNQIDDTETSAPGSGTNQAPTLSAVSDQTAVAFNSFTLQIAASDPENDFLNFSSTGLPAGLALDASTGIIAGAPTSSGIHTVQIGVKDAAGNTDTKSFNINVQEAEQFYANISTEVGLYRFVRITALAEPNGLPWASMAEFNLLDSLGQLIDRSQWIASASSESPSYPASLAIAGDEDSLWHTLFEESPSPSHPHHFVVDLGQAQEISAFVYTPRNDISNGQIIHYIFSGSNDEVNWDILSSGQLQNTMDTQTVQLGQIPTGILREYWLDFFGNSLTDFRQMPNFPVSPSGGFLISTAEAQRNVDTDFGERWRAYIVPPVTGIYRFAVSSDDASEVFLSGNHLSDQAVTIASAPAFTSIREWDRYFQQQSQPISLEAGRLYYLEALHIDTGGPDHMAIGWITPGSTQYEIIPNSALVPYQRGLLNTPPTIAATSPNEIQVAENTAIGTILANLDASDPDTNQSLTYSIVAGASGTFAIDPATGELSLLTSLDFENQKQYDLQIQITDSHSSPLATSHALRINVTNVLESNTEVVYAALTSQEGPYPGHGNPALIGLTADPDKDSIVNALELLFGTNPSIPDAPANIRVATVTHEGEVYHTFEIDVAKDLDGVLTYAFFNSTDLDEWVEPANAPELIHTTATHHTYRIRDDLPASQSTSRFFKAQIMP